MKSPWVWTAAELTRLLGVHILCSSYKALPLCWVQKRILWLGSWCGCAICRAELEPLHMETNNIQPSAGAACLIYRRNYEI